MLRLTALCVAAAAALPSHAAFVSSGYHARADSGVTIGPNSAAISIVNGTVGGSSHSGTGSVAAGQGSSPTEVWAHAAASQGDDSGLVQARADLASGIVRASSEVFDGDFPSVVSGGGGGLRETLWFTNSSTAWLPISYWIEVDGALLGGIARADWRAIGGVYVPSAAACNGSGQCIGFAADGSANAGTAFTAHYTRNAGLYFTDAMGQASHWTVTHHAPGPDAFDFTMEVMLWVPPGETTLVIEPELRLDFCGNSTGACDFGHSGRARLGMAPSGLSWTSESGVFLSALQNPGGSVPEPATWALLVGALGLMRCSARRRS